jgi:putative DeoR family transcriptional regulator (stage III sporulation protein D)
MKRQPSERAVILGEYILAENATVRAAAEWFGISKSTVHKDVSERLPFLNPDLYQGVKAVLEKNKQERHIRGGLATRRKYALLAQQQKQLEAANLLHE